MQRMPYSTGLSDEQWSLIEPLVAAWKQERVARSATGDPGSCDLREVVNALLYQNRTGCQRRLPPHDLPASSSVFSYFTLWRQDGLDQRIQETLRCRVRERARHLEDPSLVIIDTRSVRVAAGVAKKATGLDANKKTPGRKRGPAVDLMGLTIGVVILAASAGAASAQAATGGGDFTAKLACPSSGKISSTHSSTSPSGGIVHHLKSIGQNGVTIRTRYEKNGSGSTITAKLGYSCSGSTYWGGSFTQSNNTTKSKEWVRSSWQAHCCTTTGLLSVTGQRQLQTPAASC
ncbi:transposase [Streptomyces sp. Iso 434]|uniref:transposase n=2 Tax=Streptomyces TaxID=1883 RepID=UPI00398096C9